MKKIVIVGPGALGCLMAARLAGLASRDVWLLDHNPIRAGQINQQGIVLEENALTVRHTVRAEGDASVIGPADLVLLCVKSYQVATALSNTTPLFADTTLLIGFQNGIRHLSLLTATAGPGVRAAGVTAMGATLLAPGQVRFGGEGPSHIGLLTRRDNPTAHLLLESAAAILSEAGITTETSPDILCPIWAKLLVNVGINALTAIHNCPNGRLLEIPAARRELIAAVEEAAAVAHALGIPVANNPVDLTLAVCQATSANISSMLQDVRHGRRTEVDAINGAVVEEARRLGLPTQVNENLTRRVKQLEPSVSGNFS